jgi:MFS family permease
MEILVMCIMCGFITYLFSMALVYGEVFAWLRNWLEDKKDNVHCKRRRWRKLFMLLGCVMCTSTHVGYWVAAVAVVIAWWIDMFTLWQMIAFWLPIGFTAGGMASVMYELGPARNKIMQNKSKEDI